MALIGLEERERVERLEAWGDRLEDAWLTGYAFGSGKALKDEQDTYERVLGRLPVFTTGDERMSRHERELVTQIIGELAKARSAGKDS